MMGRFAAPGVGSRESEVVFSGSKAEPLLVLPHANGWKEEL